MNRIKQVVKYAWRQSKEIAPQTGKSRLWLFCDMIRCYRKYLMWTNQYVKEQFWSKNAEERDRIGTDYRKQGLVRDTWQKDFRENRKFLIKYMDIKYERASLREKRNKAYTERFHAGKNLFVEYGVNISRQHYLEGTIKIGNNVLLAKNVFIDYSGEVVIKDNVSISDGVVIESHEHPVYTNPAIGAKKVVSKTIIIEDGVIIGSRAIVHASVGLIGRNSRVGAGAVLRYSVPPYAIVMGNPAKNVGFSMTPEQVEEYERDNYPENERISIEKYTKDYNKLFLDRIDEIKQFLKKSC